MYHVFTQLSTFLRSGHLARRNILHFVCVGLFALSFALMGPLSSSVLAAPLGPPIHDGSFVQTPDYNIYRIAGGAPLHISDCAPLGGCKPLYHVPDLSQFRTVPIDGTFLLAAETGMVYRVAGGAPLHIVDCAPLNGCAGYIAVNQRTIDSLDHLNAVPTDGTFITSVDTGGVYHIAGGAPLGLSSCGGSLNGCPGSVGVNQWTIDTLDHLNAVPADGVFIQPIENASVYRIAGGAALKLSNCAPLGGCSNVVYVNQSTIDTHNHLNAVPSDGTLITGIETGNLYKVAGGAPLRITCTPLGGCPIALAVNQWTINHMRHIPMNGTVLEGLPSGTYWVINFGKRYQVQPPQPWAVVVSDSTIRKFPKGK